ncbi:MAG: 50S ribosomal protein L13 [Deltaproteobacteria bacterium]|nr:50S ribosomal protein L13 [Deltaproteobacteria bacterium]
MQSTFSAKEDEMNHAWFVVDATNMPLGRLASEIARVIRGKHRPTFTPHVDTGDFVVVINAHKVALSGNKLNNKNYYAFSGFFGGLKTTSAKDVLAQKPEHLIEHAVKGMLPKNPLGRKMFSKLKVYAAAEHPHQAQQPKPLPIRI